MIGCKIPTTAFHRASSHASALGDGAVEVLDVHEDHEAHDDVGSAGRDRQAGDVRERDPQAGVLAAGGSSERRRGIESENLVPERHELSGQAAFAASDVDSQAVRARGGSRERPAC